jgi:DNA-directed RNA polymerase subunit alpha
MVEKKKHQSLIFPSVEWNKSTLTSSYGECVASPLEAGFGTTIGNVLRRMLLGGIEGSAVTSVIIKDVNNEFSVLHGVVEDTLTILLNIKQLIIRNKTGQPGTMKLQVSGKNYVLASDIVVDSHLEILNKDLKLASLENDGILEIDFFVECGRGYQVAQWPLDKSYQEDQRIYLDATFAPVRQVTFDVQKTRVGKDIDYDKLVLSITTDGTITPEEALCYAVSIVQNQFKVFIQEEKQIDFPTFQASKQRSKDTGLQHEIITERSPDGKSILINGIVADLLLKSISVLGLPARVQNSLLSVDIERVIDLVNMTEEEVTSIKNFGRKSYEDLIQIMKEFSLTFNMKIKEKDVMELIKSHETSD